MMRTSWGQHAFDLRQIHYGSVQGIDEQIQYAEYLESHKKLWSPGGDSYEFECNLFYNALNTPSEGDWPFDLLRDAIKLQMIEGVMSYCKFDYYTQNFITTWDILKLIYECLPNGKDMINKITLELRPLIGDPEEFNIQLKLKLNAQKPKEIINQEQTDRLSAFIALYTEMHYVKEDELKGNDACESRFLKVKSATHSKFSHLYEDCYLENETSEKRVPIPKTISIKLKIFVHLRRNLANSQDNIKLFELLDYNKISINNFFRLTAHLDKLGLIIRLIENLENSQYGRNNYMTKIFKKLDHLDKLILCMDRISNVMPFCGDKAIDAALTYPDKSLEIVELCAIFANRYFFNSVNLHKLIDNREYIQQIFLTIMSLVHINKSLITEDNFNKIIKNIKYIDNLCSLIKKEKYLNQSLFDKIISLCNSEKIKEQEHKDEIPLLTVIKYHNEIINNLFINKNLETILNKMQESKVDLKAIFNYQSGGKSFIELFLKKTQDVQILKTLVKYGFELHGSTAEEGLVLSCGNYPTSYDLIYEISKLCKSSNPDLLNKLTVDRDAYNQGLNDIRAQFSEKLITVNPISIIIRQIEMQRSTNYDLLNSPEFFCASVKALLKNGSEITDEVIESALSCLFDIKWLNLLDLLLQNTTKDSDMKLKLANKIIQLKNPEKKESYSFKPVSSIPVQYNNTFFSTINNGDNLEIEANKLINELFKPTKATLCSIPVMGLIISFDQEQPDDKVSQVTDTLKLAGINARFEGARTLYGGLVKISAKIKINESCEQLIKKLKEHKESITQNRIITLPKKK